MKYNNENLQKTSIGVHAKEIAADLIKHNSLDSQNATAKFHAKDGTQDISITRKACKGQPNKIGNRFDYQYSDWTNIYNSV